MMIGSDSHDLCKSNTGSAVYSNEKEDSGVRFATHFPDTAENDSSVKL
jgi:hypothetical protein